MTITRARSARPAGESGQRAPRANFFAILGSKLPKMKKTASRARSAKVKFAAASKVSATLRSPAGVTLVRRRSQVGFCTASPVIRPPRRDFGEPAPEDAIDDFLSSDDAPHAHEESAQAGGASRADEDRELAFEARRRAASHAAAAIDRDGL